MESARDFELLIRSRIPLIVVETHEELRVIELARRLSRPLHMPVFKWTVTEGLQRIDIESAPQRFNAEAADVLGHIKGARLAGIYVMLDVHPYLDDPAHVRLLKDIALGYDETPSTLILVGHEVQLPPELRRFSARFRLSLPDEAEARRIVSEVAAEWRREHVGTAPKVDRQALDLLVRNLAGLARGDVRRLARASIVDDGAITASDIPAVMKSKHALLARGGVLGFELDTAKFSEVGGLKRLRTWLEQRRGPFVGKAPPGLDPPRGILLLGVQGCGKSLAAKATAGVLGVPLLHLDFGALYNKFYGESERNLRESLATAELMAPCVLWMDEIEKGIATGDSDSGTSRRMLGTLLTWMAERERPVFLVATANDIAGLPPELVRKGRFDEIFFVDLPDAGARADIAAIHLRKRGLDPEQFDLDRIARAAEGFSGAEIEQAVVSALYAAHADGGRPDTDAVLAEVAATRPLSVVMAERVDALRAWAAGRTVPAG
jgi:MoxR-like ATPase